jgi:hypothetical protein
MAYIFMQGLQSWQAVSRASNLKKHLVKFCGLRNTGALLDQRCISTIMQKMHTASKDSRKYHGASFCSILYFFLTIFCFSMAKNIYLFLVAT